MAWVGCEAVEAASDVAEDLEIERELLLFVDRWPVRMVGRKIFLVADDDELVLPRGRTLVAAALAWWENAGEASKAKAAAETMMREAVFFTS